jgi:hypothetical protein
MKYYVLINIIIYLLNTNTEIILRGRGTAIRHSYSIALSKFCEKMESKQKMEVCAGETASGIRVFAQRIYKK